MTSKNDTLTPNQRFWRLLKPDQKEITNVHIYALFNGLVTLSLPLGIQTIVNLIQGGQVSTAWIVLVVIVVVGLAAAGILQIFQLRITEDLQQKIFTRSSFEFAYRVPKIKLEAIHKYYAPELINRFFDTISVQKGVSKILIDFSVASLQVLFGLILLSFYHPFFIAFSFILVLLAVAIFRLTSKKGLETSLEESKYKYQVAHWLEELGRTSNTFKLAGHSDLPFSKTNSFVEKYLDARENHFKVLVQQYSMMVGFKVLVGFGLLFIGGFLVIEQLMNIGQFVAAEIIILLVLNSVEKLVLTLETIYDVFTSLEKIGQVTDLELEKQDGLEIPESDTGIEVEYHKVGFRYPNTEKMVFEDFNLKIGSGKKVLITGGDGSGKSSFLYLTAGLYDLKEGSISYDGYAKGSLNLESLRGSIGDALGQEQLFEGTIIDNIGAGREKASIENIQWAIKNLLLEGFIKSLPNGKNTNIKPYGENLPKGVTQKMLLARAVADQPRLLLLDDPFSFLDHEEKENIIKFIFDPEKPWTVICISSDKEVEKYCDEIVDLSHGQVQVKPISR